jgi:hypothetical protein
MRLQPVAFFLNSIDDQVQISMDHPTRANAGVPAPHFSQDEVLSRLGGKRQRGAVIPPCQHCARVHRSDQEKDRCEGVAEAAAATAARIIGQQQVEEARASQVCNTCGRRHRSEGTAP